MLRQARLPATLHASPQSFVSTGEFFDVWRAIEALSGDPSIGLTLTEKTETALTPPSMLSAFYARDYADGLGRLARFKQLCTPESLIIDRRAEGVTISTEWPFAVGPPPGAAADADLAAIIELGRRGTRHQVVALAVELTRRDPGHGRHRDYFGCAVRFSASRDLIRLRTEDLDLPFPGHNAEMLALMTPALSGALDEIRANSSMRDTVKVVLKRRMASGRPELADVAAELGTSERTLQRRITDEGTTFRRLVEEARRELGRQMLQSGTVGVDEIAYLLGFQEVSSFYRAFREWEGVTPSDWRDRVVQRTIQ